MKFDGSALRARRERAGLTLKGLSDKSGVSLSAISMLETGARGGPSLKTLGRLADALGVKWNIFLAKEEKK